MHELLNARNSRLSRLAANSAAAVGILFCSLSMQAQTQVIKGTVVDEKGEPLIGATIRVKGTTAGATTDLSGKYTIKAAKGAVILASYVGCNEQQVKVTGSDEINFTLNSDPQTLDDVVVVGYGVMKKKDLTGAVASVKGDKVEARRTTQLDNALQGAIAGVQVTRAGGSPGAAANNIVIRGVTTIGDSSPLIIVDGVPVDNMNDVNAAAVESVTVLKDAASAAIYGARAAAGVILITTKRGAENVCKITYNFEYGTERPTSQPSQVGFQRYMEMTNELRYNDNPAGGRFQEYMEEQVNNWVANSASDPDQYPITDWYDLLVKGSAPRQSHVLNLTGGTKKVRTRATMSYDKIDGLFKEAKQQYQRFMVRTNNDYKINKYISAGLDLNLNYNVVEKPEFTSVWTAIFNYSPAWAHKYQNGAMGDVKGGSNPYGRLVNGGDIKTPTLKAGGKFNLDITPVDGLKLSAIVAPNITYKSPKTFIKAVPYYTPEDPVTIAGYLADHQFTNLTEERVNSHSVTWQGLANYMKSFGKHDINALLGYESYYYYHEDLTVARDRYELDNFPYISAGNKDYTSASGGAYENAYQSFFGRLAYSFDGKYLVQANFRRDGSSRFDSKYRWGNFPSVSLGWVLTQEKFMQDISPAVLSFIKLRGSWGRLGNERIGNYPYIGMMSFTNALLYDENGVPTFYPGAAQVQYALRDITWETTESYDLGIDARFLNNRLAFTADFYRKDTKDMLLQLEIPKYLGFSNPEQNAGKMYTKGYDLELSWNDRIADVSYSASVNFSDYISKMGDLRGTSIDGSGKRNIAGSFYNEWYGYEADGLYQTENDFYDEFGNYVTPLTGNATKLGDIRYKDLNGDGKITPEGDKKFLGNSLPRYLYGGTLGASWKGVDFSCAFQGVGKQTVRYTETMVQPLKNNWGAIPGILDGNYWSEPQLDTDGNPDPAQVARNLNAFFPRLTNTNKTANNETSSYWLFNGAYFRMKNITLGYTLPKAVSRKVFMDQVRLYVSANDLFCIHNYPTGYDPERTAAQYPITKSIIFGLNVNF